MFEAGLKVQEIIFFQVRKNMSQNKVTVNRANLQAGSGCRLHPGLWFLGCQA